MDNLVFSNILYRKTRTITTAAGVAVGVALVVLTVGLVHGFLHDQGRRNSAVTAEIIFRSQGNSILSIATTLDIKPETVAQLAAIDGVAEVVPIGQYTHSGRVIDGVDYERFTHVSEMRVVEGRPIESGDEVMIDRVSQRDRRLKVGDETDIFDRPFRVVGIYEPESLGRLKVPLATLQAHLHRPDLYSLVLIKVNNVAAQGEVAKRIKEAFPKASVQLTRDIPVLYAQGTPAMQTFLNVVVGLAVIVSSLVILLAMYTTVTERTKQIGILKSLGASKTWIAGEIEKEALVISLLGVIAGFALSVVGRSVIHRYSPMQIELEPIWFVYTLALGLLSGLLGALYPALRAANQDPVKALSYE